MEAYGFLNKSRHFANLATGVPSMKSLASACIQLEHAARKALGFAFGLKDGGLCSTYLTPSATGLD